MKKRLKLIFWVLQEQLRISKLLFAWRFVYSIYDGLISIAFVYAGAQLISAVTKVALTNGPSSEVYKWLAITLCIDIISYITPTLNNLLVQRINSKIQIAFNEKLMRKIYELSQEQFESETFNTQISRAHDGLNSAESTLNEISWMLSSTVRFSSAFIAIAAISPVVGLVIVAVCTPAFFVNTRLNRYREKFYKEIEPTERITYRTRWMLVDPQYMPEIRFINGFSQLIEQWKTHKEKIDESYLRLDRRAGLTQASLRILQPFAETGAVLVFFRALARGNIGLDQFLFLRNLIGQLINTIDAITDSLHSLDQRFIELENMDAVFKTAPAIPNGTVAVTKPLTIEFKNVSFRYPNSKRFTLRNISLLIIPGSKLAIVGENGAGKSTLLKLLLRQYLPTEGTILVNGTDIADIDFESYYAALSSLSQQFTMMHHLPIRDNLTLGINKKTEAELKHALELVGADEFVKALPHKLDSRLDSSFKDGTDLSGGQMQRLAVARSILRNGDVMILDEPTSAIDAKAEYSIFNNIYREHAGRTTIIVSHRFSTVRKADGIIVMENGRITEYGSHEELIMHKGLYKEMFDLQAEGYK